MKLPIYQVDAFASKVFSGNPAAVVPLDEWLPDDTMQGIAQENNLSETAFFVASRNGQADFDLRWFTPAFEVDLCGHATLASGHVLARHLGFRGDAIRFQSRSGPLRVLVSGERLTLDFPANGHVPIDVPAAFEEVVGGRPSALYRATKPDTPSVYHMAVYESEDEVRAAAPDCRRLVEMGLGYLIVTAPGDEADFVSRFFAPLAGIDEDPVTGSAHCMTAPYWAKRLGRDELEARQVSKRGGDLRCKVAGDRVLISGHAVTYLTGEISVEPARILMPRC